jgi:antitoxin HigA-1
MNLYGIIEFGGSLDADTLYNRSVTKSFRICDWEKSGMSEEKMAPVHPGEVLLEEFLKPLGLSQHRLALDLGVDPRRINEIVLGKRSITANTALRLARYFETSPEFWLGLQAQYDLDVEEDEFGDRLERDVKVYADRN